MASTPQTRLRLTTVIVLCGVIAYALATFLAAAQQTTVTRTQIDANKDGWQDTPVVLQAGETATMGIVSTGAAGWAPDIEVGPEGFFVETPCELAVPTAPLGALLVRVGTQPPQPLVLSPGLTGPGRVSFLYNDCPGAYGDNRGGWLLELTVRTPATATATPTPSPTPSPTATATATAAPVVTVAPAATATATRPPATPTTAVTVAAPAATQRPATVTAPVEHDDEGGSDVPWWPFAAVTAVAAAGVWAWRGTGGGRPAPGDGAAARRLAGGGPPPEGTVPAATGGTEGTGGSAGEGAAGIVTTDEAATADGAGGVGTPADRASDADHDSTAGEGSGTGAGTAVGSGLLLGGAAVAAGALARNGAGSGAAHAAELGGKAPVVSESASGGAPNTMTATPTAESRAGAPAPAEPSLTDASSDTGGAAGDVSAAPMGSAGAAPAGPDGGAPGVTASAEDAAAAGPAGGQPVVVGAAGAASSSPAAAAAADFGTAADGGASGSATAVGGGAALAGVTAASLSDYVPETPDTVSDSGIQPQAGGLGVREQDSTLSAGDAAATGTVAATGESGGVLGVVSPASAVTPSGFDAGSAPSSTLGSIGAGDARRQPVPGAGGVAGAGSEPPAATAPTAEISTSPHGLTGEPASAVTSSAGAAAGSGSAAPAAAPAGSGAGGDTVGRTAGVAAGAITMAVFRGGGGAAGVGGGSGGDAAGPRMLSGGRAATGSGGGLEIKEQGPISFTSAGDRIVTLHNSSDAAAVINRIEFRGPASTDFTAHGPALPLTLASRARARYLVRFDPSAPGQRRAILSFGGGAGDLAAVGLVGEGQSVAASAGSQTPAVPLAAVEEAETKVRTEGTSSQVRDLSAGQSAAVAGAAGSNLDHVLDRAYEKWNVEQLVDAPVDALQGVSKRDAEALERAFGIRTIGDMGANRFFLWARSVVALFESGEGGKIEKGR